jgi:hypothetical protein
VCFVSQAKGRGRTQPSPPPLCAPPQTPLLPTLNSPCPSLSSPPPPIFPFPPSNLLHSVSSPLNYFTMAEEAPQTGKMTPFPRYVMFVAEARAKQSHLANHLPRLFAQQHGHPDQVQDRRPGVPEGSPSCYRYEATLLVAGCGLRTCRHLSPSLCARRARPIFSSHRLMLFRMVPRGRQHCGAVRAWRQASGG